MPIKKLSLAEYETYLRSFGDIKPELIRSICDKLYPEKEVERYFKHGKLQNYL